MYKEEENQEKKFSLFKNAEKHFRVHKKCDCKLDLITFDKQEDYQRDVIKRTFIIQSLEKNILVAELKNLEGFYIIKNYLNLEEQLIVAQLALNEFPSKLIRQTSLNKYVYL